MKLNLSASEVDVPDREMARLMQWPAGKPFTAGTIQLIEEARRAFAEIANPWFAARRVQVGSVSENWISLEEDIEFQDDDLAQKLARYESPEIVVLGMTVGREIQQAISNLWIDECGDEAYALATFANAYVEQMLKKLYEKVCEYAAQNEMAALEPRSPGNDGWHLSNQLMLARLIRDDPEMTEEFPITVLETGSVDPQASLFAMCIMTKRLDLAQSNPGYRPCSKCSLRGCKFRRSAALSD